jgi:hypothetical protein
MRTITIKTTSLQEMRALLQQSTTWPNEQTISKELTYSEGPWEQDNRDSVLEQGFESSGLSSQTCCPNKDCTQKMPTVISGLRNIDDPASPSTPEITQESTWFKPLLDPLRGSGWIGNSVLLGSTPPDRDTTVTWGVFFKGAVCRENKFQKVLRDPESIFFTFSFLDCHVFPAVSHSDIVHLV